MNIDERDPATTAPMPRCRFATSVVDQNEPHGFGSSGKVVAATGELTIANQPDVGLMNQCRGIERLAWLFLGKLLRRKLAQSA